MKLNPDAVVEARDIAAAEQVNTKTAAVPLDQR
jgi:hypothetical protein